MSYTKHSQYKKVKKQADLFFKELLPAYKKCVVLKSKGFGDDYERAINEINKIYEKWHDSNLYIAYGGLYCRILEDINRVVYEDLN